MGAARSHHRIPPRLVELTRGYRGARVFLTALDLDLFVRLGNDRLEAAAIAERIEADPGATEILLDALHALELVDRTAHGYANRADCAALWSSETTIERNGFAHASRAWNLWSDLTERVRSGTRMAAGGGSDWAWGVRQSSATQTESIAEAVDWSRRHRVLDVGGGTGVHAIGLAKRFANLEAIVFDASDTALTIAAESIARDGLRDRVTVRQGDFLRDDLGIDHDTALLSSTLCLLEESDARALLSRVATTLGEHGVLVVHDLMMDGGGTRAAGPALFGVHLLLASPSGRCHRSADVVHWVRESGLDTVRVMPVGLASIVVGTRGS